MLEVVEVVQDQLDHQDQVELAVVELVELQQEV
jgi:hypothetical protein